MQTFDVHVLGCGSALPTVRHKPSSQVVNLREKLLMLDCGEGTQEQWRRTGLSWTKLGHIFITHTHGDHVFGLPGMLSTMGLLGRTSSLQIYGTELLRPFMEHVLQSFCSCMPYEVTYIPIDTGVHEVVWEDGSMKVWSIPLHHRTPCAGFLIEEKPGLPHIRREMIDFYQIPIWAINRIKQGEDWVTADGTVVPNARLTSPADPIRRYAYCTDTMPTHSIVPWIEGADLLFHEATYASDKKEQARKVGHSTAAEAATIAREAGVKQLMIGHFSSRYEDEHQHLEEAQAIFPNTILAREGLCVKL